MLKLLFLGCYFWRLTLFLLEILRSFSHSLCLFGGLKLFKNAKDLIIFNLGSFLVHIINLYKRVDPLNIINAFPIFGVRLLDWSQAHHGDQPGLVLLTFGLQLFIAACLALGKLALRVGFVEVVLNFLSDHLIVLYHCGLNKQKK